MTRQLKLLLVEDSEIDTELVLHELRRHGYQVTHERVDTPGRLRDTLETEAWDVVLCDHNLPAFNSSEAFQIVRELAPAMPFLILSGTIGEEAAVEALKAGARDVILKTNLSRLGAVIDREREEAKVRRQQEFAEHALLVSEARKSAILDSALDCVITIDHAGQIVEFNPAAEATFGYRKEAAIGQPMVGLLVPPSLRQREKVGFASFLGPAGGEIVNERIEVSAMRADASEFPAELLVTQGDLSGEPFFTGYLRDITDNKRAEQERESLEAQLRQAQKMEAIGRLAGGIAHDFNNLLTVIIGFSEITLARLDEMSPLYEDVRQIELAGRRASALTGKLLAFSRHQVLEPRPLNMNKVVRDIAPILQRLIGEDIELVIRLDAEVGQVYADLSQLDQVIMNLVVNARDAMPSGGRLTIETDAIDLDQAQAAHYSGGEAGPGSYALLAVADTGCGIDEETRSRIFEPFFTTKDADKGTGLGLSTVYGIATQSGGFVRLESETGRGSLFNVYLPITRAGEEDKPATPAEEDDSAEAQCTETVLLVEDDEPVRSLVQGILESRGYEVLVAASGAAALAISDRHDAEIHLGVSDIVMPGMNGLALAEQLRSRRPEIKLLLMSGYTDQTLHELRRLGTGTAFIQKPFSATKLTRRARELLDAH